MEPKALGEVTMTFTKSGLTAGATTTYTTATAVAGCIQGKFHDGLASGTDTATPTTDINGDTFTPLQADEGCVFVYGCIAAGTILVAQGPIVKVDPNTDKFIVAPEFPSIPETLAPFGYVIFKTAGNSSAWTFGSSSNTATGVTDLYEDVGVLPAKPQVI